MAVVVPLAHISRPIGGAEDAADDLATFAQEICAMHWPDPHRSETEVEANARLIARAPELLDENIRLMAERYELLEALQAIMSEDVDPVHVGYDHSGNSDWSDAVRTDSDAFCHARALLAKICPPEA